MAETTKKRRRTLAKQVVESLKKEQFPHFAADLCAYGRPLSDFEKGLRTYFGTQLLMNNAIKGVMKLRRKEAKTMEVKFPGKPKRLMTYSESMTCMHEFCKKHISDEFFKAIDECDSEKILEIARAVWFFRDKRPNNFVAVDPERKKLLHFKIMLPPWEKCTIRQVAEYLADKKDIPTPADGFSALRRKCKQLGIPLVESRKRSKK